MGYGIRSEDFVAVCIHAAKGDMTARVSEVTSMLCGAEWPDYHGATTDDIHSAFLFLWLDEGLLRLVNMPDSLTQLEQTPLEKWIPAILERGYVYFNDEGSYWEAHEGGAPSQRNLLMRRIMGSDMGHDPEAVLLWLNSHGWSEASLRPQVLRESWVG